MGAAAPEGEVVHTALCVEPRDGHLHLFLPPLPHLETYVELINAIEKIAAKLESPVVVEGYEPPHDARLQRLRVTPDPGVIEVNIHPAHSWQELVQNTTALYEEARLSRLGGSCLAFMDCSATFFAYDTACTLRLPRPQCRTESSHRVRPARAGARVFLIQRNSQLKRAS